jgi:Glycosyltransferases involved in cell wall biogenesis
MRLSLCIPAYNEEKNIHLPLSSAIDLVDEVVIVDGGSTDKTVEVAKSYGKKVRIIFSDNPSMFHKNKQKAIEEAKGEWILQLDADEALSNELKKEIANILKDKNSPAKLKEKNEKKLKLEKGVEDEVVGYYIPRKNWFLTRFLTKGGSYPDYTIRLYKNGVAYFPCRDVHENVKINGRIAYLKNPILHYADPNFSRYLLRFDRYTTFDAEELLKKYPKEKMNTIRKIWLFIDYFFIKPLVWFLKTYIRHKGFLDGFAGFVFCLFSSIRFWVIYIKYRTMIANQK